MNRILLITVVIVVVIGGSVGGIMAYSYVVSQNMKVLGLASSINPYEVLSNQSESILPSAIPHFNVSIYSSSASRLRLFITSPEGNTLELYNEPVIGHENISEPTASISLALATYSFLSRQGNFTVTAELFKNTTIVEKNITERVMPPLSATVSGPTVATGKSTENFKVEVTGGIPPYSFKWRDESPLLQLFNSSSKVDNATFAVNSSGNWTVYALVTDSINFTALASMSITDYQSPTISAEYDPVDVGIRDNLSVNTYGNTQSFTYKWELYPQGQILGNSKNISYSFSIAGKYELAATLTDVSGEVVNASLNVTVNPPPIINAHLEYSEVDLGTTDKVNFTITGGTSYLGISYNYSIFLAGELISSGYAYSNTSNDELISTPLQQGTFTVTVVVSDGCGYTVRENLTLIVNPYMQVSISEHGSTSLGNVITLIASIQGGTSPFNYSWIIAVPNGSTINVYSQSVSVTLSQSGYYYISLYVTDSFIETGSDTYSFYVSA